jgi:hypothetical protein
MRETGSANLKKNEQKCGGIIDKYTSVQGFLVDCMCLDKS